MPLPTTGVPVHPRGLRAYGGTSLSVGLRSFWPMTEVDGVQVRDVVGNWHAARLNSPVYLPGGVGGIPALQVAAGSANRALAPGGRFGWATQFSVSAWFRPTAYNSDFSRILESSPTAGGFSIEFDAGSVALPDRVYGVIWNGGSAGLLVPDTTTSLNEWHLAVLTFDGVQGRLFLDGVLRAGPTTFTNSVPSPFVFRMGNYNDATTNTFAGQLGPMGYWARALSATEVLLLYRDPYAPLRRPAPFAAATRPRAAVTGTATASITEADVVAGGKTIVITLTNDTWVAAGAAFNAERAAILQGLDSAQAEGTGWNAVVRDAEVVTAVVRTSNTVVTITLSAAATYDITATETITVTVPASALTGAAALTATPTFTVSAAAATTPSGNLMLMGVG